MPSFLSSSFCTIFASSPTDTNVDTFMDFQKKPLDVENSTLSKFGERVLEVWKGATRRCTRARWVVACEGTKKAACLQFVLQGRMKAKEAVWAQRGPERARARVSNVPKYHTRLSGKARLRDCHKPGAAAMGGGNGWGAMMAMSGDGVGSGHDRR